MTETDAPDVPRADDLSKLYGAAAQPEPPAALGEQLRHAAREAVQGPARERAWRWRHGAAVAAVVVLSVSILLLLPREQLNLPSDEPLRAPSVGDAPPQPATPMPEALQLPEPASTRKREAAGDDRQEALPSQAPRLQQAPAEESARDRGTADAASNLQRAPASTDGVGETAQPPRADAEPEAEQVLEKSYYRSSPELWISHIERLLSEGRFAEARREFDAFKARHPQHPYAAQR